jgi:uncharacterized protein with PQ loop repeat
MLGAVASFFSLSSVVPQVLRALRTRDVAGVSWATSVMSLAAYTLWVVYAFAVADGVQVFNNVLSFALLGALAFAVARAGGAGGAGWAAPRAVLLSAALALLVVETFGAFALAMASTAFSSVRMLPQTRLALSGTSLSGLDPLALVLGWFGHVLWAVYGALTGDLGVLVCSGIALTMHTAVVQARFRRGATLVAGDYELAA